MNNENDKNYVSVWSWMWMMFVTALPCIGLIMVLVWAFTGENESRKNYFKAILMWFVVTVVLVAIIAAIGGWPQMQKHIQDLMHKK
jgi:heme/copper-type cytochrome/quinol oxidase subunit 2